LEFAPTAGYIKTREWLMHWVKIGPRYVSKRAAFVSADVEKVTLLDALATAPGVMFTGLIEPHFKGDHRASLEIDSDLLDQFIAHMDSRGWMDGF
jgi:hypothetical protein